jgi:hypothetical protein
MLNEILAGLCALHLPLGAEGKVTVVEKVEPPLAQRVMKETLPNYGSLFEAPFERWHITVDFPQMTISFYENGSINIRVGQTVSSEGEMCVTPFRLHAQMPK